MKTSTLTARKEGLSNFSKSGPGAKPSKDIDENDDQIAPIEEDDVDDFDLPLDDDFNEFDVDDDDDDDDDF